MKRIDFDKTTKLLGVLTEQLQSALNTAKQLANEFGDDPCNIGPRIDAYLVGALESFLDNEHQCGSIPDIEDGMRELQAENADA